MTTTDLPGGPERRNISGADAFNNFVAGLTLDGLFDRGSKLEAETRQNLSNPRRWVEAFGTANIFNVTVVPQVTAVRNRALTARDLLETMSEAERVNQFRRFMEDVLPENVRKSLAPGGLPPVPTEAQKTRILTTIALVLGLRSPSAVPGAPEPMLARIAFDTIYPATGPDRLGGAIYQDYLETVEKILSIEGIGTEPSPAQLSSREELLKLLEERETRLPPGRYLRFLGWLRVEDPKIAQARLAAMGAQRQRGVLAGQQITLKTNTLVENLSQGPREDAERRNRTFLQNFGTLEPWQQYALIGVGLFAAWRMWRSPGRFLGIIPYWTIPTGLLGWYVYRRLITGDTDALNTITGTVQGGVNRLTDTGTRLFNRGLPPQTMAQRDRSNLALMARFLNQRAFLNNFTVAAPMMTIAEVKMRNLASDNVFSATLGPDNRINYVFGTEDERHPLYLEVQGIIKRRRYDRETMHRIFYECNPQIAQGIGAVFYQLAARRPANRDRVRIIEEARQRDAQFSATGPASLSYDNIRDPAIKRMFIDLVTEGRVIALQQHPDENFVDLIQTFMNEGPERVDRPDNAERIEAPNLTRPGARALFRTVREQPLLADRDPSAKTSLAEFREFLDFSRRGRFEILDLQAREILEKFAEQLLNDRTKPLTDVLLLLERVKYAVLVGAAARAGGSPLGRQEIERIIGREEDGGWRDIPARFNALTRFINSEIVTLSGNFQDIQGISQVIAILSAPYFRDVQSGPGGLAALGKQLWEHQSRFNQLRNPTQASQSFLNSIALSDPAAVTRLGGPDAARSFFRRLIDFPSYVTLVNQAERYYAQRVTTEIVVAQISTHRGDGNHDLDFDPARRFISPTEERNIIANNEFLLEQIIGLPNRPMNGMWAAMAMRQLPQDFNADSFSFITGNPGQDQAERIRALESVRRLAALYLALQPLPTSATGPLGLPGAPALSNVDLVLRSRIRTIARKFVDDWTQFETLIPAAMQELKKFQQEVMKLQTQYDSVVNSISATNLNIVTQQTNPALGLTGPAMLTQLQVVLQTLEQQRSKLDAQLQSKRSDVQNQHNLVQSLQKQEKQHREALMKNPVFLDAVKDIVSTMQLLNMVSGADVSLLNTVVRGIGSGSGVASPALPLIVPPSAPPPPAFPNIPPLSPPATPPGIPPANTPPGVPPANAPPGVPLANTPPGLPGIANPPGIPPVTGGVNPPLGVPNAAANTPPGVPQQPGVNQAPPPGVLPAPNTPPGVPNVTTNTPPGVPGTPNAATGNTNGQQTPPPP